jgi:hypothetical protein
MRGQWQPYPNNPEVLELTRRLEDLKEQSLDAVTMGDIPSARRLWEEREAIQERLDELNAGLLRNDTLVPRWIVHTEENAAAGAIPCLECGNNIPAGESCCSYCGWTYQADMPSDTGKSKERLLE